MNITKIQTPCGVSRRTFLDEEHDTIYVVDGGEDIRVIMKQREQRTNGTKPREYISVENGTRRKIVGRMIRYEAVKCLLP